MRLSSYMSFYGTSNDGDMSYMFSEAKSFKGDMNFWDTSNVTYMRCMFGKIILILLMNINHNLYWFNKKLLRETLDI